MNKPHIAVRILVILVLVIVFVPVTAAHMIYAALKAALIILVAECITAANIIGKML